MPRLAAATLLVLLHLTALCARVEGRPTFDYAGRPLAEALEDLRSRGLRLVYGDSVVLPEMMVETAPRSTTPREVLDEILAEHRLAVHESAAGILSVVVAADGTIFGAVRHEKTGEPLAGADVVVESSVVRADSEGRFAIEGLRPGEYDLEARKAGYIIDRRRARVESGARTEIVFRLTPVAKTLEEMTVIPGQVSLLGVEPSAEILWTRDDVNRLPHLSDDLYRAVSRLPGIAAGDFSADFHVRGGERHEVLVTLDGLRVYEPYHLKDFQNVFSIFDTNATEAVDVMSGGFTAEYGDRMSGVVEIVSAVPLERRTMLGVSFEKLHFLSQDRFAGGDGGWLVNARRGYLDLILDSVQTDQDDFNLSPVYHDLFAKVRRSVGEGGLLSVSVLGASDEVEFRSDDDDDDLKSSYGNAYAWALFDSVLGAGASQVSVLSYGRLDSERDGESGANLSDSFNVRDSPADRTRVFDRRMTTIAQLRHDWRLAVSERQHLKAGLEVRRLEAEYEYRLVNRVSDPVFTDGEIVTMRELELRPEGWTYGVYAADRFRLGDRVAVEAGARWDRQTYVDDEQWSPRVNLVAQLHASTTLRASWGRYWQSQGIHELQVIDGVTTFHPAQLNRQTTLALDQRLGGRSRLSVQLYDKSLEHPRPRFENLFEPIDIFPEGQSDRVLIVPEKGRSRGLELLFERRRDRIDWWFAYTLSETEDRIDGVWVPRSWDQRHAVSYSVNLEPNEHWNLNFAGLHHTGWPATDVSLVEDPEGGPPRLVPGERNRDRYPDYHRVDVRASRAFVVNRGEIKLFLEITNLLGRKNIRSISDFEIVTSAASEATIEREFEEWFPRVPSFGVTWTF